MLKIIREDIRVIFERDPAAKNLLEVLLSYSGLHAIMFYRITHKFHIWGLTTIARLISQLARFLTGIEIHPGSKIGRGIFIDHGAGVVIGETTEIGNNVTIYQGVTGKEKGKRHPTIGNNVMISAGAKVLGSIEIGNNVKVGAGSVLLHSVPDDCTVVGVPGRVVIQKGSKVPRVDLDQSLPDPITDIIIGLQERVDILEELVQKQFGGDKKS